MHLFDSILQVNREVFLASRAESALTFERTKDGSLCSRKDRVMK